MSRKKARKARPTRLCIAHSFAFGAAVVVAELRGGPSQFWEKVLPVVDASDVLAESVEFGLSIARTLGLRDFELGSSSQLQPAHLDGREEFGLIQVRRLKGKKNGPAQRLARARHRALFPRPVHEENSQSLADYGVELEIARMTEEAADRQATVDALVREAKRELSARRYERAFALLLEAWHLDEPQRAQWIDRLAADRPPPLREDEAWDDELEG